MSARNLRGAGEILVGAAVTAAWLVLALAAPWIAPNDPNAIDLGAVLVAPGAEH